MNFKKNLNAAQKQDLSLEKNYNSIPKRCFFDIFENRVIMFVGVISRFL
jgi:hypothetical protein